MQDIREIGGVHFIFFGGILPAELLDEFDKLRHGAAHQAHIFGMFSGRDAHNIRYFFQQILELFAGGHDRVFCLALIALRHTPETHIFDCVKCFESLVPVSVDFFAKLGVHIYIALHRRAVGVRKDRVRLHGISQTYFFIIPPQQLLLISGWEYSSISESSHKSGNG